MKLALKYRSAIPEARRIVIKIGSRVLVQKTGRPDVRRMRSLVKEIAALHHGGHEVAVVTSGAIGAGMEALGMRTRPASLPDLQMAAAVGQTRLMARYAELFHARDCTVGQVLLTHADFHHKVRMTNARRTVENLLRSKVVPVINENDAVADEEIRADLAVGDNDLLASLVVRLIRADLLLLMTTANGVREPGVNGRTRRVSFIESVNKKTLALANPHDSSLSRGGMQSKLKVARDVARSGCTTVIANGRETGMITRIMKGEDAGTIILAS